MAISTVVCPPPTSRAGLRPRGQVAQCIKDGRAFLREWGLQAELLKWSSADLFAVHAPPAKPHPSYRRLSRYDCTGLCWLLGGRVVVALTEDTATIKNEMTGTTTTYRRLHKPALGPLGT